MIEKVDISIPTTKEFVKKMKNTGSKDIHKEFFSRIILIVIAGFGLMSILAWDGALKDLYKIIVTDSDSLLGKFGYAILITFISVVVSIMLSRIFMKNKPKT